jgi:glycerol-3-phosphate dehydrogenase
MAEDVINKAIQTAHLPHKVCITSGLSIKAPRVKAKISSKDFLHPDFHYTEQIIQYFVEEEMAMKVEDVLARRTRILFLNAKVAMAVAAPIAQQMANLLERDEQWIQNEITSFTQLANQYCLNDE